MSHKITDYFDLLDIDRNATKEAIQKAFMHKASIWHPDKASNDKDRDYYTRVYQDLLVAYKILSNDNSRRQYLDSQQNTDMDLKRASRQVHYEPTPLFRTGAGTFDEVKFNQSFHQARDQQERKAMEHLGARAGNAPVTNDQLQSYIKSRTLDITPVSELLSNFNSDVFNRVFDVIKEKSPDQGVQLYVEPTGVSSGGLVEDNMSSINFDTNIRFGEATDMSALVKGAVPDIDICTIKGFYGDSKYGVQSKLSTHDIQQGVASIQASRRQLSSMDKSQFVVELSEVEKMYPDLFAPMNIECLEAPVQDVVVPRDSDRIRRKIQSKRV
jgi:curved DNA-binding protein CbpA